VSTKYRPVRNSAVKIVKPMYHTTSKFFDLAGQKFLEQERTDVRELGINNTANTYACTGVYPLDPYCLAWTIAISTLGWDSLVNKNKMAYKIILKSDLPVLTN
jgi:hypothetical protein